MQARARRFPATTRPIPTPVDGRANLHTVACYGHPLGVRCRSCSRRALVPLNVIGAKSGDMRELDTLPFKCRTCSGRTVELWLFVVRDEVVGHRAGLGLRTSPRVVDILAIR